MKQNEIITAYHGTDQKNFKDILNNGFKIKKNNRHWLGNGIYFYLDHNLAKWWSNSPTKRFGSKNYNPIVVKADIISNRDNTIDTRILDDYEYLLELYSEFINETFKGGKITQKTNFEDLRCSFFDWVHDNFNGTDIFIAGFEKSKSFKRQNNDLKYKFHIPYIEYQMCVFDNDLIFNKEIFNGEKEN